MALRRRSVLVIYKKTGLQLAKRGAARRRLEALIAAGDPAVSQVRQAHASHMESMDRTKAALHSLGVKGTFRYNVSEEEINAGHDLIVTLGGDGTLLWASHHIGAGIPVVAVNSAPGTSLGFFCAGDRNNLEATLEAALDGSLKATRLARMKVESGEHVLASRVLNDILYCHASPAVTVRYIIEHGDCVEEHRSSGIWAGPAAGSTAAQHSAGGKVLPISSRKIQYVVREPYMALGTSYKLSKGLVKVGESVTLRSKMRDGRVFVDGAQRVHKVALGQTIRLSCSDEPLTMLGLRAR